LFDTGAAEAFFAAYRIEVGSIHKEFTMLFRIEETDKHLTLSPNIHIESISWHVRYSDPAVWGTVPFGIDGADDSLTAQDFCPFAANDFLNLSKGHPEFELVQDFFG